MFYFRFVLRPPPWKWITNIQPTPCILLTNLEMKLQQPENDHAERILFVSVNSDKVNLYTTANVTVYN